jgi:exopolyphosphatase/pppGpp-phosphohydrolase
MAHARLADPLEDPNIESVLTMARSCGYESEHSHQVAAISLSLFDQLNEEHDLGCEERFLLNAGALLHDIGWMEGGRGHHKTALRLILDSSSLPFDRRWRLLVGSIARYHRKALPNAEKHDHFRGLNEPERKKVRMLAGILRTADGLDRTHRSVVEAVRVHPLRNRIEIDCKVRIPAEAERLTAVRKGKLLEMELGRSLEIQCR